MRDRFDHWLVIAMAIAEACRGVRELITYIRRPSRPQPVAKHQRAMGLLSRLWQYRRLAEHAAIGVLAVIPVLYYAAHAMT